MRLSFPVLVFVFSLISFAGFRGSSEQKSGKKKMDFKKQIEPIFKKHCHSCHGARKQESGLRLDKKEEAFEGGERGEAIVPGKKAKSLLYEYVAGLDPDIVMPPDGDDLKKNKSNSSAVGSTKGQTGPTNRKNNRQDGRVQLSLHCVFFSISEILSTRRL